MLTFDCWGCVDWCSALPALLKGHRTSEYDNRQSDRPLEHRSTRRSNLKIITAFTKLTYSVGVKQRHLSSMSSNDVHLESEMSSIQLDTDYGHYLCTNVQPMLMYRIFSSARFVQWYIGILCLRWWRLKLFCIHCCCCCCCRCCCIYIVCWHKLLSAADTCWWHAGHKTECWDDGCYGAGDQGSHHTTEVRLPSGELPNLVHSLLN